MHSYGLTLTGPLLDGSGPRVVASTMQSWVNGVGPAYLRTLRQLMEPDETGTLIESTFYEPNRVGIGGFVGSTLPDEATAAIEEGREPGKPPPPPGSLLAYLEARGIPLEFEYPIAKRIGEEGYWGHFYWARAFNRNRGLLTSQVAVLEADVARRLS
jgi:hypothetical protein